MRDWAFTPHCHQHKPVLLSSATRCQYFCSAFRAPERTLRFLLYRQETSCFREMKIGHRDDFSIREWFDTRYTGFYSSDSGARFRDSCVNHDPTLLHSSAEFASGNRVHHVKPLLSQSRQVDRQEQRSPDSHLLILDVP